MDESFVRRAARDVGHVAPASASGSGQAEQITSDPPVYDFSWTPDGQMILTNSTDFTLNLFNLESSSKTPLTSLQDGFAFQPSPCADGRYVVFSLANHGAANAVTIWRMDAGGGNLKQLVTASLMGMPSAHRMGNGCFTWIYPPA